MATQSISIMHRIFDNSTCAGILNTKPLPKPPFLANFDTSFITTCFKILIFVVPFCIAMTLVKSINLQFCHYDNINK